MMSPHAAQTHRIGRQVIELTLQRGGAPADGLANEVSRIYRQRIVPLIEQTCNELAGPDQVLRLDTLELDLGVVQAEELEPQLVSRVAASLRQQLQAASAQAQGQSRESVKQQSALELFTTFVGSGSVPWWAGRHNPALLSANLQQLLRDSPAALKSALAGLVRDPLACQRLASQYDDAQLARLCALYLPAAGKVIGPCMRTLRTALQRCASGRAWPPERLRQRIWCCALAQATGGVGGAGNAANPSHVGIHADTGAGRDAGSSIADHGSPIAGSGGSGGWAHFLHALLLQLAQEMACEGIELIRAVLQVLRDGKLANSAPLLATLQSVPGFALPPAAAAGSEAAARLLQRLLRLQLASSGALREAWRQLRMQVKKQLAAEMAARPPAAQDPGADAGWRQLQETLTGSAEQAARQMLARLPGMAVLEMRALAPLFAAALPAEPQGDVLPRRQAQQEKALETATRRADGRENDPPGSAQPAADKSPHNPADHGRGNSLRNPADHVNGNASSNRADDVNGTPASNRADDVNGSSSSNRADIVNGTPASNRPDDLNGNSASNRADDVNGNSSSTRADHGNNKPSRHPAGPGAAASAVTAEGAVQAGNDVANRSARGGEAVLAILLRRYHSRGGSLADLLAVMRDTCWQWTPTVQLHWLQALAPELAHGAEAGADSGPLAGSAGLVTDFATLAPRVRRMALLEPDTLAQAVARMLQASPARHGLGGRQRSRLLSLLRAPQRIADAGDSVPIDNAGLILLWPFLGSFFGHLGLLEERDFKDLAARQRAVGLLQVLATPQARIAEYALPLNKLLCNLEQMHPFEFGPRLKKRELRECNQLLEAVIAQAPILRNMSPDGFRGSFLLRNGVLSARAGHWLLQVEAQTYDIVLDRLPWNRDWIKLPWMEAPLRVEWST